MGGYLIPDFEMNGVSDRKHYQQQQENQMIGVSLRVWGISSSSSIILGEVDEDLVDSLLQVFEMEARIEPKLIKVGFHPF